MSKPFKLSAVIMGHSLDVRCVTSTEDNSIISGSRDKTAKFWRSNGFNCGYTEATTYKDQRNFVASVLYLNPSKEFPDGLVITGGNDNTILVYKPLEPFATLTIKEHTNTVCCLSKGIEPNTFLSASWDTSSKLWNLNNIHSSVVTFNGHTAAVWSVIQLINSHIVTASADKTIAVWFKDGSKFTSIQGHSDCVRDLADFPEMNMFASVSNDATIKFWTYSGKNTDVLYGHKNYIYSIARNKAGGEKCFVTSDEDRTVRYWNNGINSEVIHLPCQSVWSVCCLTNGDIVTGSSDGVVRIFTQDESRYATAEMLKIYDEEVAALQKQSCQEIGGYKVSDLPGREALYDPGKKAGQMKMIREAQGVVAYTWVDDGDNSHWEKVGDVLGGTDKNQEGKTVFEGKGYDFVFSVDVEDGKPPLKLPFNKGDDPYNAAQLFLSRNNLPQIYLDQVVDFILKNSQTEMPKFDSDFVDPFTGSSRYAPSGSGSSVGSGQAGNNTDPFTGSSGYTTENFFPQSQYRSFDMGDPQVILNKLKEFNQKFGDGKGKVDESLLEDIIKLCKQSSSESRCINGLFDLLSWSDDVIFPVIDVLRLALKNGHNNKIISTRNNGSVVEKLKEYLGPNCKLQNNMVVTLRALCNFFCHPFGEELMYKNRIELLENIIGISANNKNIEVGLTTFLLNTAVLSNKKHDNVGVLLLADILPEIVVNISDPEAQFRGLVALGTLLSQESVVGREQVKVKILENNKCTQKISSFASESVAVNDVEKKRNRCALQMQKELFH